MMKGKYLVIPGIFKYLSYLNRFSKYSSIPFLKNFLTFQYLIIANKELRLWKTEINLLFLYIYCSGTVVNGSGIVSNR